MPLPQNYQDLMLPALKAIEKKPVAIKDLLSEISDSLKLSDEERAQKVGKGNYTKIYTQLNWAIAYMFQAGLIDRPQRGWVSITQEGAKVLASNPSKIDNEFLKKFPSFVSFVMRSKEDQKNNQDKPDQQVTESQTPEELIDVSVSQLQDSTRKEILDLILQSSPSFFERLILDLFTAMGYGGKDQSSHVGRSGDGGIDGIINEDPLGLDKIYLQAKRYKSDNKINIEQIRSFAGSLEERGANKGIFVTTSSFVQSAFDYVNKISKSIILIDGEKLTDLMYQYDVGVRTVQILKIKKPDIDYFEEL